MASAVCLFLMELQRPRDSICPMHRHPCTEVIYYKNCRGFLILGKNRISYKDGCFSIYQPSEEHADECSRSGIQWCFGIKGCGADQLPSGLWRASPEIREGFEKLARELHHRDRDHAMALDLFSAQIVLEARRLLIPSAARDLQKDESEKTSLVTSVKTLMENQMNRPLKIRKIAEELFISPDYLRQIFRQHTGESPLHYLLRRRIEEACRLLEDTHDPVKQIAHRVGIPNPYYFSRLFCRQIGRSPVAYRKSRQNTAVK